MPLTTPAEILRELRKRSADTLMSVLGIEVTKLEGQKLFGRMPVDARTRQTLGLLHGGATAAFAETLGSYAANLQVACPEEYCVGIEISASHLKSVSDGYVEGCASPLKIGRRIQVWEIRITDQSGQLICVARLTLAVLKRSEGKHRAQKA